MRSIILGEKFKSTSTGREYEVKLVKSEIVVSESDYKLSQMLTEMDNLRLFYKKMEFESVPKEFLTLPSSLQINTGKDHGSK
jgi:hypothetical protein